MDISLEDVKNIMQRFEAAVLVLNGSKKADGEVNTQGLIPMLESILTRLDPKSVDFITNQARVEAVKQHQKIEELLVAQDQYFQNRITALDVILKSSEDRLEKLSNTIEERIKQALNRDVGLVANGLQLRINEKTSDVMNKFDEFLTQLDDFKNNTGNNNLWLMIALIFGVCVGVGIGAWLL